MSFEQRDMLTFLPDEMDTPLNVGEHLILKFEHPHKTYLHCRGQ